MALLGSALAVSAGACASATSPVTYTPYTGIRVAPEAILGSHSCGQGPGQIAEYVVAVEAFADGEAGAANGNDAEAGLSFITANLFDCHTDAVFQNLPNDGLYTLRVYAYGAYPVEPSLPCSAGSCLVEAGDPDSTYGFNATFVTTCWATQYSGNNAGAACEPLAAMDGGAAVDSGAALTPDAALEVSATEPADEGEAGGDLSEGGD